MFDISFTELLIIALVALVVLGPERLPKVARTMGHLLGRAQRYMGDVKRDIQKEMELEDIKDLKEEMHKASSTVKSSISDLGKEFKDPLKQFESDLKDPFQEARDAVQNLRKETEDSVGDLTKSATEGITSQTTESSPDAASTQKDTPPAATTTDTAALKAADKADELSAEVSTENTQGQPDPVTSAAPRPTASKTAAGLRAGSGLPQQPATSRPSTSASARADTTTQTTDQPQAKPRHTDLPSSHDAADADGAD
ncbi:MAG TPA: Sec-independent protein translocase protein TatB [Paenalcaligenes sp.]|nr:Sec-independent protein translocase protein TatB [Paenalcaligenes sp.]